MGEFAQYLEQVKFVLYLLIVVLVAGLNIKIFSQPMSRNERMLGVFSLLAVVSFFLGMFILQRPVELQMISFVLGCSFILYALLHYSKIKKETGQK